MNRIIVNFQPFTIQQHILIYKNDVCVETVAVPMDRLMDSLAGLKKVYQADKISLHGNQNYLSKFKDEINTKFEEDPCEIEII